MVDVILLEQAVGGAFGTPEEIKTWVTLLKCF
jgi:hypothetical protein